MSTNTIPAVENFADLLKLLEGAGLTADKVNQILSDADKEREAIAEANKILEAKSYPESDRELSLDEMRDNFFAFAKFLSESIVITPGDPNGGNKNTRADRRQIEIPTPTGVLNIRLLHN
jgi:hypothetical protein